MLFRSEGRPDRPGRVRHPVSCECGESAVGAGIPSPVIGTSGEAVGFRRIAPRTTTATGAATTVVGADLTEPGPAMAGGDRVPMEIGVTTTMTDPRFLRRIEGACESLRAGCGVRIEDVE